MSRALGLGTFSYGKICSFIVLTFIFLLVLVSFPAVHGQTSTNFTSKDTFSIPSSNAQIGFTVNGTYSSATLNGNVWTFTNLHLNRSSTLGILKISADNSDVKIQSYTYQNGTNIPNERLRYIVVGEGKVTVNLGQSNAGQYGGSDWYVTKAGRGQTTFYAVGRDYVLGNDGTLTINGITGNVTITHNFLERASGNNSNLPFYQQHSVIIVTAIVVVVTFAFVMVIWLKNNRITTRLNQNGDDS
jgi:hypothetical protein